MDGQLGWTFRISSDAFISFALCGLTVCGFLAFSSECGHWFVLPVWLAGTLIGVDGVRWLRGRIDLYDPVGILGAFGIHFFFLAPLLHVAWNFWIDRVQQPADWRTWLGQMAILNCMGIAVYQGTRKTVMQQLARRSSAVHWRIDPAKFKPTLLLLLAVTCALQIAVYAKYGGILGYMRNYSTGDGSFRGMGWVFMVSESFPVLAMIGAAVFLQNRRRVPSWAILACAMLVFFVVQLLFGGLRGSRSNTVWAVFWAVGIIHLAIRRVPRSLFATGIVCFCVFMYVYGFYKSFGVDAIDVLDEQEAFVDLTDRNTRTLPVVLLGDFARSSIQSYLLFRLTSGEVLDDYEYAKGQTYLGAAALLVPQSVVPIRPPRKGKFGTEAQFGAGTYVPGEWFSRRVYGLAGETMLNFGPLLIPVAFVVFGVVVAFVQHWFESWDIADSRLLLVPFLVNACIIMLMNDSDNIVWFLVKNGMTLFFLIALTSTRVGDPNRAVLDSKVSSHGGSGDVRPGREPDA